MATPKQGTRLAERRTVRGVRRAAPRGLPGAVPTPASGFANDLSRLAEQVRDPLLGHLSPEGTDRIDLAGHPGSRSTTDPRNRAAPARPNGGSRRRGCSCAILASKGRILLANRTVEECLATPIKGLGLLSDGQCAASVGRPHGDYQAQSLPPLRGFAKDLSRLAEAGPRSAVRSPLTGRKRTVRLCGSPGRAPPPIRGIEPCTPTRTEEDRTDVDGVLSSRVRAASY